MDARKTETKGERTREQIVELAAPLFNRRGYTGVSMADVMAVTGLQKGGIYRYFESKEALAVEAFEWAVARMAARFDAALSAASPLAHHRILAIVSVYVTLPVDPPVPGGCPVLNAAVHNDDGNAVLRERAEVAIRRLEGLLVRSFGEGQEKGEYVRRVRAEEIGHFVLAVLEGGVAVARLERSPRPMIHAAKKLASFLEGFLTKKGRERAALAVSPLAPWLD